MDFIFGTWSQLCRVEYLHYSWIPEPIKPLKVLTISNNLSQKIWNKNSKFQKTVIRKIPLHSWRAWRNWFFSILAFLALVIFQSIFSDLMDQKITGAKNVTFMKKSVSLCSSTSQINFRILYMLWLYFHDWILKLWHVISK